MNNLAYLRKERGLSQKEVAKRLNIAQNTLSNYELGNRSIDNDLLIKLAELFQVSTDYLLGIGQYNKNQPPQPSTKGSKWIPVLGEVIAGQPVEAIEEILDWEEISADMVKSGEYFALQIKGDSMEPRIREKDVVIVKIQSDVENGEIAIVRVNGDAATCKQFSKHDKGISLVSFNSKYPPMFYPSDDVKKLPITIIGKVVELRAKF